MSDSYGYNVLNSDIPGLWITGGKVTIGATGAPTFIGQPSGIVSKITRLGVGQYSITLKENWYALVGVDIKSEIASTQSPAYVGCQIQTDTVGTTAPTVLPVITFQFNVAGTPTEIPSGSAFRFELKLKRSSA